MASTPSATTSGCPGLQARRAAAAALLGAGVVLASGAAMTAAAEPPPKLPPARIIETGGVRFGIFGDKPAAPAPTVILLAGSIEEVEQQPIHGEAGARLASHGWLTISIDVPCHGKDHREGEPGSLPGWAHRLKAGQDLMGDFTARCRKTLDLLIAEKYTDPARVALCGTSRGGFCAFHFAAVDPRVRVVTAVSPVTRLRTLTEFTTLSDEQTKPIDGEAVATALANRAVGITIGNDDLRVGTTDCVAFYGKLVAEARKKSPQQAVLPLELLVGPSPGHRAVDDAYQHAADFIRKHAAGS